jgi:hypothetical protein
MTYVSAKTVADKPPVMTAVFRVFPKTLIELARLAQQTQQRTGLSYCAWLDLEDAPAVYADALSRHLLALAQWEKADSDSGAMHEIAIAYNALVLAELALTRPASIPARARVNAVPR